MQTTITIKAETRQGHGKGPARRLRAQGKIPAIVYGPQKDNVSIAVEPKSIQTILTADLGRNTVFTLDIAGQSQLAMIKSFEYHPVSRELEHADFYIVELGRKVQVEVPFATVGKAKGVAAGGILRQVYRKLPVKCTPDKIPAKIEIDVTNIELGGTMAAKDLNLGDGVSIMLDQNQTIVNVVAPEKEVAPTAAATTAAATPAATPAAGAKPAAGGDKAKAAAPAAGKAAPAAGGEKAPAKKK